jgi:hypothetical protein
MDKNGNLLTSGQLTNGIGFTIVVEGQPEPSHSAVGDVTFNSQPNDPSALPDLQIRVSQPFIPSVSSRAATFVIMSWSTARDGGATALRSSRPMLGHQRHPQRVAVRL